MFEKRLFSLVPQATPYIVASVLFKWIALMANITVMWVLARILGGIVIGGLPTSLAIDALKQAALPLAAAIIVRAASIYLAQRAGDKAAFEAVRRVRSLVYDKLTALGPSYTETVPTAEAVQTSVEGATQLQVYFGGYLPQLFFAGLAPIILFVLLAGQAGLPAALLLACVPVIPVSIMMVMRNAKKIGAEYWGSYVDLSGMFLEAVQGLTTLKVYQADRDWHERINAESERFRGATMRLLVMQLRSICVMDLVVYMGAALGIIVAALQLASGKIGFDAAFLIVFLSQEFFLPMRRLGSLFHTAMNGMAASRRMFSILDTPEPERGNVELDGRGDIELSGVSYAYGDRTVLDGADAIGERGGRGARPPPWGRLRPGCWRGGRCGPRALRCCLASVFPLFSVLQAPCSLRPSAPASARAQLPLRLLRAQFRPVFSALRPVFPLRGGAFCRARAAPGAPGRARRPTDDRIPPGSCGGSAFQCLPDTPAPPGRRS